ncbi:TonB-dependent hemoglobin/transferrin/lactoferrin family receptor [Simiduia agarivorans]|uniref:TonB-dependent hemin, ferrichrome receptor n=1 Tax=Simiduia agarivorans (strain DSM 21679 / JCM 13881 / BCRC 17597 / SA1) TaxID=1117647 RepID=K4L2F2_SIMAS|nr:TonB-dependent hemoglobin/transferrin/lactoferrin family receptor [Simiduia agarivorans]AFV00368.1 TonB-dependent hemin, ferrichrome receptor [Simiduia agarivorans SA1 = DSM 21679]
MYRHLSRGLVPASLFSTLALSASLAQAEQQTFELQSVVVSATRVNQNQVEANRSLAVVTREQLDIKQPQTVAEALQAEPNIEINGGPRAFNQQVNIRGLSGNKVLQTVDGVQQRFESGHRPSYFLDPVLIQQVEVIKGPASSLWGSGAVGGVVAMQTISASDLLAPNANFGGLVKTGYTDNNAHSASTLALAGRSGSVDWLASGYYRDGDDLEMGNGETLLGSKTRDFGGMLKMDWALADNQLLTAQIREAQAVGQVPSNGSADSNGSSNFDINREQTVRNAQLNYAWDADADWLNLQASVYLNDVTMDESRVSDGRADSTESRTVGFNLLNQSNTGAVEWLYGVDGYRESFSASRSGDNRPTPPDAENDVVGAFVSAGIPLTESWQLELGARYDRFATRADNLAQDRSDSATSPTAAITWKATDWLRMSLRHDQAFRAPGSEELYTTGFHFCMFPGFCNAFVPNPGLKAETAANTELLAQLGFDNVWGEDYLTLEASLFNNRVDDFIEQIVVGPSFGPVMDPGYTTWVNVDKATIKGFELTAEYLRANWNLKLGYGQTRGTDDNTGEDLTGIPADKWTLDGAYQFSGTGVKTGVRLMAVNEQSRTDYAANSTGQTYDGYTIVDVYAQWQPASLNGLQVDLALNNLTDAYYRRAWSELYEQGRAITLSAHYRF